MITKVITPDRILAQVDAQSVLLPDSNGYVCILDNHVPLISTVGIGVLLIKDKQGQETLFFVSGGLIEVSRQGDSITLSLFLDECLTKEEIPMQTVKERLQKAQHELERMDPATDIPFNLVEIEKANKQIQYINQ